MAGIVAALLGSTRAAAVAAGASSSYNISLTGLAVNLEAAPSSGTTWTDRSGNSRNATLNGTTTYMSNNGGGIKLNNSTYTGTSYISVPYNINSSTMTVELVASFNPSSFWATIWGNEIYNSSSGYAAYMTSATAIGYGKTNLLAAETITASNNIRHWIFVINGASHSLYLNGTQQGTTQSKTAQTIFPTNNFYFGARHTNAGTGATDVMNNSNTSFQPTLYQLRIYNRALSGADITQNYNAIKTTYGI